MVTSNTSQAPLANAGVGGGSAVAAAAALTTTTTTEATSKTSLVKTNINNINNNASIGHKRLLASQSPSPSTFLLEAAAGPVDQAKNTLRLLVPIPPTSNSTV